MPTKYSLDCEFIDDGKTIDLISIGLVCEDEREYYAQSLEFEADNASTWVRENVFPHLDVGCSCFTIDSRHAIEDMQDSHLLSGGLLRHRKLYPACPWRLHGEIAREILAFMDVEQYGKPELWGYYSAYDHVAFCQLFGTMMDLPAGFPMLTYDLRQWLDNNELRDIRQPDDAPHNALADARWIAETYKRFHIDTDF